MEKYFVINLETNKEGVTSKAIYEYNTLKEAVAMFYTKMASGLKNAELINVANAVLNMHGGTEIKEYWEAEPATEEA